MTGQPVRANASAEQKYRGLLDKRDMEARHADAARDERDLLQARRRELIEASKAARAKRDQLSDEARVHEAVAHAARARLQGAARRQQKGRNKGPETEEEKHDRLRAEIADAERRLEREPMKIADEKALVEATRRKKREADKIKAAIAAKAPENAGAPDDLPHDEESLKHIIDEAAARAQGLRGQAQSAHEEAQKHSEEIDALTKEADIKHAKVLEYRAKASEIHEKAMKMRELVIAERAKRNAERDEGRHAADEQSAKVKTELYDEARLEREADEAVAALKAKGRLSL